MSARRLSALLWACGFCAAAWAQQADLPQDTIGAVLPGEVRSYDGFLLDLGSIAPKAEPLQPEISLGYALRPKSISLWKPSLLPSALSFKSPATWSSPRFAPSAWNNFWNASPHIRMASFKLKNGMTLSSYGQYDAQGNRLPQASALPGQRHAFEGGMELRSANGKFGFSMHVSNYPVFP